MTHPSSTLLGLSTQMTPTDPHAHHRRDALARRRSLKRARRLALASRLNLMA